METSAFISLLEDIINRFENKLLPYDLTTATQIINNCQIVYNNFSPDSDHTILFDSYSALLTGDFENDISIFRIILENLIILSTQQQIIQDKNNAYHLLRCEYSYNINLQKNTAFLRSLTEDQLNEYNNIAIDTKKHKGCIYTVVTGGYDCVNDPLYIDPNLDYILFTDNPDKFDSAIWQTRLLPNANNLSPHLLSRYVKILPYEFLHDYDFSIYIDGNVEITGDIVELISTYNTTCSMLCLNHIQRDCIYEEAVACIGLKKDAAATISAQIEEFRKQSYPSHNGLINGAVLIRNHNNSLQKKVMLDWWQIVSTQSKRDQLSFNYVAWNNNFIYDSLPFPYSENSYFRIHSHL